MTLAEYLKAPYAWPGGYHIRPIMADGEMICLGCARTETQFHDSDADPDDFTDEQWRIVGYEIFWEGPVTCCCHCYATIESEYGEPEVQS